MSCEIECPLNHPSKCDLIETPRRCATWRINQPDMVARFKKHDAHGLSRARRNDREKPIPGIGLPRFMVAAGNEARKRFMEVGRW